MTVGQDFYQQQVAALEAQDVDALVAQYHEDAVMIGFDFTVRGHEAIRAHLTAYLAKLGGMKLVSTNRFAETEDSIFFEATVHTPLAEAKVYDVFMLRDGRATHQFTGVISVSPLTFPTYVFAGEDDMSHHSGLTEAGIRALVDAWYLGLDQHAPTDLMGTFVSDDVQMIFPEKTLHGRSDFLAWCIGGTYSDGEQAPGVYNIFFDEDHNVVSVDAKIVGDEAELDVVVAWQASMFIPPAAKSKRVSLDAIQKWTVKASDKNVYGMVVTSYNAMTKPFVYTPGFARL